jgi:hypothetical protein
MALEYGFDQQLRYSHGVAAGLDVRGILLSQIPGAVSVAAANETDDRRGTDWWVTMRSGDALSVDAKIRSKDYAIKGHDDLALETWSVVEREKVGWTRDPAKRTDYVLWLWTDTGRWCLVPFPMLCGVFSLNWEGWRATYKWARQKTPTDGGGYHSECVFVPRRELWAALYRCYGGAPVGVTP